MTVQNFQKTEVKNLKGQMVPAVKYYIAKQYRWQDSADPQVDDQYFFLTEEEAKRHLQSINMNIGYAPVIERVAIELDEFEEVEEFELEDIQDIIPHNTSSVHIYEVYNGGEFKGNSITGSIVIDWNYEKYVGYARNLVNIGIAGEYPFHEFKTEADLISGNEDRTFHSNYSVLLTAQEVEEAGDLQEAINEALNNGNWKWNSFKNNPDSGLIREKIEALCNE